jgi:phenylacetate-CoA ligase
MRIKPDVIVAVPSFMLRLAREAESMGVAPDSLKKALLIGETIRGEDMALNHLGRLVEEAWNLECFSTYGITEASVAFTECALRSGFHSHPDFVYTEILDGDGCAVQAGEAGELVVTTFKVEGMPLVRYGTGDICVKVEGACECGNASPRIGSVIGRKAQKLKVKGTTVYPGAIENALLKVDGVVNYHITAYTGEGGIDMVRVVVGVGSGGEAAATILNEARSSVRALARFVPDIKIATPEEVERLLCQSGSRKKVVFKDDRKKGSNA